MNDWSQVVQQYGSMVWKTVYRILNHDADAADCFQNTFLGAWQLEKAEPIHHWPAVLRRLATARALERLRQRYREAGHLTELTARSNSPNFTTSPSESAEAKELAEHLREALAELEPRQAQVFCLAYLEGYTYVEIGEQVGLTANHVGVLLTRVRSLLKERLRNHRPE
jgi:RNA polymerase sigma-70 factor (ECF subfamily)